MGISFVNKCILPLGVILITSTLLEGQSGSLQLNILLDDHQKLRWVRTYSAFLSGSIPLHFTLGQLEGENSIVGLMEIEGIKEDLPLRGIINENELTLIEWYGDEIESGRLEIQLENNALSGYWYNQNKSRQFSIDSGKNSPKKTGQIRQYAGNGSVFFTYEKNGREVITGDKVVSQEQWENKMITEDCVYIADSEISNRRYCPGASVKTYDLLEVDLFRVVMGNIPFLEEDEVFNEQISEQINNWKKQIYSYEVSNVSENRWSMNHLIWFDPDIITDKVISGMLSVQYSGPAEIHSYSFIYDRQKKEFYTQEKFFRSHTPWIKSFQNQCKAKILSKHGELLKLFPHITKNLVYHLTLSPNGLVVSTDFTSYFGRLKYFVQSSDLTDQVQRFAPFRDELSKK